MSATTTARLSKQTIASEQKRINGQSFSMNMIRSPKPPPSPSPSMSSMAHLGRLLSPTSLRSPHPPPSPSPSMASVRSAIAPEIQAAAGIAPEPHEIRLQKLQQIAHKYVAGNENPLIDAIKETMDASKIVRAENLKRNDYEDVERRLEEFILSKGGCVPIL